MGVGSYDESNEGARDTQALKSAINRLRSIDAVFDAYRVTPTGG